MLWDTAGQEEFDCITRAYYRCGPHFSPLLRARQISNWTIFFVKMLNPGAPRLACLPSLVWTRSRSNRWWEPNIRLTHPLEGDSMEKKGGGGVWQHPHGAGHDKDGPVLPGHHRRLWGREVVKNPRHQIAEDFGEGELERQHSLWVPRLTTSQRAFSVDGRSPNHPGIENWVTYHSLCYWHCHCPCRCV